MIFAFLNLIPKPIYALAVAGLGGLLLVTSWNLHTQKTKYEKLDKQFISYRLEAVSNAAKAQAAIQLLETAATDNERKTRDEQDRLQKINAAERAGLVRVIAGLRGEQDRFTTGIAANAKSGDIAALAARATTANQLLGRCTARYTDLGERAEKTRLQALGLYQYIRGNPLCAAGFGSAAPEPGGAP